MSSKMKPIASGIVGVLVVALIVGFFRAPIEAIKWIGAPLLALPSALGIAPYVTAGEVQTVSLYENSPRVTVTRPGQYAIYADDRDVLSRANMLEGVGASWMTAQLTETNAVSVTSASQARINGISVSRGVRPYDPVTVPGRPILTFSLPEAGEYVLSYPPQSGTVYFAPDDVTGREGLIVMVVAAQFIALVGVVLLLRWPQLRREKQQREQLAVKLAQKLSASDAFWQDRARDEKQDDTNTQG